MRSNVLASIFLLILSGCTCADPTADASVRLTGVQRVLMHEPGHYTIFARDEKTRELISHEFYGEPRIFADIPPGEPMWAVYQTHPDAHCMCHRAVRDGGTYAHRRDLEIHVHSGRNIGGAGWDRGEDGKGTTEVVE